MFFDFDCASSFIMDLTTLFLLLGIWLSTGVMRRRGRRDDRLFFRLLGLNAIVALSDMAVYYYYFKDGTGMVESCIQTAALSVYFLAILLFSMFFLCYVDARFFAEKSRIKDRWKLLTIPFWAMAVLFMVNLFTGSLFSYDETGNIYSYGPLYVLIYAVLAFYIFYALSLILSFNRNYKYKKLIPIWLYFLPMTACMAAPFLFGGVSMAAVGILSGIVFTHIGSMQEAIGVNLKEEGGSRS